jgi:2'-5' RNA ligase
MISGMAPSDRGSGASGRSPGPDARRAAGGGRPGEQGGDPEPRARLFVAAFPSDAVLRRLAALERPALRGVRWTTPEQWHVTLAFLGDVPESRIGALGAALDGAARAVAATPEARLGPATTRYGRSVLGVPVVGLGDLAAAVRAALDRLPAPWPAAGSARPFDGHLTLARGRGGGPVPAALTGLPLAGSWRVEEICLVRSRLGAEGARYTTLVRAAVRPRAGRPAIPHRTPVRH